MLAWRRGGGGGGGGGGLGGGGGGGGGGRGLWWGRGGQWGSGGLRGFSRVALPACDDLEFPAAQGSGFLSRSCHRIAMGSIAS
eukprot:COSAG02_NODE_596_length_19794_cov_14.707591_6_plen_83_part_00